MFYSNGLDLAEYFYTLTKSCVCIDPLMQLKAIDSFYKACSATAQDYSRRAAKL